MVGCKKCGKEFEPQKGLISYCSLKCRNARIWNEEDKLKKSNSAKNSLKIHQAKELRKKEIVCKGCSNVFKTKINKNIRIFCSSAILFTDEI